MPSIVLDLPKLHSGQAEVKGHPARFKVVCAGRRWGKNVLWHDLAIEGVLRGWNVGWGSPSYKNLTDDWRALSSLLQPLSNRTLEQDRRIEAKTGGVLEFWSLDSPDAIRGRKYRRFIVNEAATVKDLLQTWNQIIRPTLIDEHGDGMIGGTPAGVNDYQTIYQMGLGGEGDWNSWHFTSYQNPHIDPSELDTLRSTMTQEQFEQEILAEFKQGSGSVFRNLDAALMAPNEGPEKHKEHMVVGGIDWGRSNDFTVLALGCVECGREVYLDRFNQVDWAFQVQRVEGVSKKWGVKRWDVELNSIGGPNFESLQRMGLPVTGFTTTHVSKQPLIESLSLALETGRIMLLPDEVGKSELQAYQRRVTPTGLSTYGAPDGGHDDTVIARALMWRAMQIAPKRLKVDYTPSKYDKALAGFFNQRRKYG